MKEFFLVYVLMTGQGTEMHVSVQMPDEEHCEWLAAQHTYAKEYYVGPPEPGQTEYAHVREIEEVYCVEG